MEEEIVVEKPSETAKKIAKLLEEKAKLGADLETLAARRSALVAEVEQIDASIATKKQAMQELNNSLRALTGL